MASHVRTRCRIATVRFIGSKRVDRLSVLESSGATRENALGLARTDETPSGLRPTCATSDPLARIRIPNQTSGTQYTWPASRMKSCSPVRDVGTDRAGSLATRPQTIQRKPHSAWAGRGRSPAPPHTTSGWRDEFRILHASEDHVRPVHGHAVNLPAGQHTALKHREASLVRSRSGRAITLDHGQVGSTFPVHSYTEHQQRYAQALETPTNHELGVVPVGWDHSIGIRPTNERLGLPCQTGADIIVG